MKQNFIIVPAKLRLVVLASFILWKCRFATSPRKILIFLPTQDSVDYHCELFDRCLNNGECEETAEPPSKYGNNELTDDAKDVLGENADELDDSMEERSRRNGSMDIKLFKLHGSMIQKDRMDVFKKFRASESDGGILLCTDVAARGLDLPQVDWIVQVCRNRNPTEDFG